MQTITTKFLPATNNLGCRIKVTSWLGSKTYSYDYSVNEPHLAAFEKYLEMLNKNMQEKYGTECPADGWFKLVAWAGLPDSRGFAFIVK